MSGGLHSLATIIKRLEAATSRLEDLAAEGSQSQSLRGDSTPDEPAPHIATAAEHTSSSPPPKSVPAPAVEDPRSVVAFDELVIEGKFKPFLALTKSFAASSVIEQTELFRRELEDLRTFLRVAATCRKPDDGTLGKLLAPLRADIEAITRSKEANLKDRGWSNHMMVLSEGASCIGWVTVASKPGQYVKEIIDSVLFYGHRIIKDFKEKDAKHAEWVKAYTAILEQMRLYIVEYHTTGLTWNPTGPPAEYPALLPDTSTGSAAPPPPPPPPPPPGRPPPPVQPTTTSGPSGGGVAAVFADLNQGADVTKGLRKVDKSEMTHKNPSLRAGSVVPPQSTSSAGKKPVRPTKPQALMGKKPAKFALEGNKWVIEYQENANDLCVENGEINHIISLFGCKRTTIVIKGKVNAVTISNCTKTSVLVESVISAVSITNSPSFALQITGSAPTIQLDSTDSGQIYLSKQCLGVEIITAKCSSINISLPVEGEEDGVFKESAVPEMLKTIVQDGQLVTTVVEHVG